MSAQKDCEWCAERPAMFEVQVAVLYYPLAEAEKVRLCGACLSDVELRAQIHRRIFDAKSHQRPDSVRL